MSPDVAISNGKHGPFIPPTQFAKAPHMYFQNVISLRWQFPSFYKNHTNLFTPLLISYRAPQIQKSGEDLLREQFWWAYHVRLPDKELPDWIPYSWVGGIILWSSFLVFSLLCRPYEISGIFVDSDPILRKAEIPTKATKNAPGNLTDRVRQCMISTDELCFAG